MPSREPGQPRLPATRAEPRICLSEPEPEVPERPAGWVAEGPGQPHRNPTSPRSGPPPQGPHGHGGT